MADIINPEETALARETALSDIEKEVGIFGRRAKAPADKVAFAELQQELLQVRGKWAAGGLLPAELAKAG